MFRKAKNIDTAFRDMRLVALSVVVLSLIAATVVCFKSFDFVRQTQQVIYVLANEQALQAYASDRKDNLAVQARSHIKNFHRLFFTLTPDDKYIQESINRALYLADHSAKKQYDNFRESNYYAGIVSGNISQRLIADSVVLDLEASPIRFLFYGTQEITRPTSVVVRSLIADGVLREVRQSDNNPHGFLIERWRILENKDISSKKR